MDGLVPSSSSAFRWEWCSAVEDWVSVQLWVNDTVLVWSIIICHSDTTFSSTQSLIVMFVCVSVFNMAGLSGDVFVMSLNMQFFIINVVLDRDAHPSQHVSKRGCEERMIFINLTFSSWRVDEQRAMRETLGVRGEEGEGEEVWWWVRCEGTVGYE